MLIIDTYFYPKLPLTPNSLLVKPWGAWLEHRRLLQTALQRDRMIAYSQVMVEYAARAISSWPRNQAFDLHKRLMRLTLEITIKNVLGLDFSASETDTIITSLETTLRLFGDKAERLLEMDTPLKQAFRSGVAQLDELVYRAIAQRRLQSAQDQGDMLSVLMSLTKPDGSQLSDKELRDEVVTLLRAGHRNTSTLLAWVFVALTQNPSVTAKLHTELGRVLGLHSQLQGKQGQLPTPASLPALRYSEMVIKETLRLYPLYPTNVRKVVQSCQLAGYTIPAGSRVVASVWAAHRNPRYFDQPANFKPERWSANYSPTTSLAMPVPKYAYFPFGGGPRQCPFKAYGMLEAVLLLAVIAQQYQVKLAPAYKLKFQTTANGLLPKGGLQVILSEH